MHRVLSLLLFGCVLASPVAAAGEPVLSKQYAACMDRSGANDWAMRDCIADETGRQDARLNKAYRALLAQTRAERKGALQTAQRLWVQFRDANCGFYYDPEGGTLDRLAANACVMNMTAERADELQKLAN
jgi:uncharacterized protein YecT (DUF1311 family)